MWTQRVWTFRLIMRSRTPARSSLGRMAVGPGSMTELSAASWTVWGPRLCRHEGQFGELRDMIPNIAGVDASPLAAVAPFRSVTSL